MDGLFDKDVERAMGLTRESDEELKMRRRKERRMKDVLEDDYESEPSLGTIDEEQISSEKEEELKGLSFDEASDLRTSRFAIGAWSRKRKIRKKKEKEFKREELLKKSELEKNKAVEKRKTDFVRNRLKIWAGDFRSAGGSISDEKGDDAASVSIILEVLATSLYAISNVFDKPFWTTQEYTGEDADTKAKGWEGKGEDGEHLPLGTSVKKSRFRHKVKSASEKIVNPEFNGFESEIEKFVSQLSNNVERINDTLSDEKQKGKITAIKNAMSGIKERITTQKQKATEEREAVDFGNIFARAMTEGEVGADGFIPDYSVSKKDSSKDYIFKMRYKEKKVSGISKENFKKLIEDAFGTDEGVIKQLEEANKDNEFVNFFLNNLYLPYQMFRTFKQNKQTAEASGVFVGIVDRMVSLVGGLAEYKHTFDNKLYYFVLNLGENLSRSDAGKEDFKPRLHSETMGLDEEKIQKREDEVRGNLLDEGDGDKLFSQKTDKELNKGKSIAERYYKYSEIQNIIKNFDIVNWVDMDPACAEKLCKIEAADSLTGFERSWDSLRFLVGQRDLEKGQFANVRVQKAFDNLKVKDKDGKATKNITLKTLVITDVIALGGPRANWLYDLKRKPALGPEREREWKQRPRTFEGSKRVPIPRVVMTGKMAEKLQGLEKPEDLKKLVYKDTDGETEKDALEPIYARFLMYWLAIKKPADLKESELQEELKLIKKYYPYAVETEESKPSEPPATGTSTPSEPKMQSPSEKSQMDIETQSPKDVSSLTPQPSSPPGTPTLGSTEDSKEPTAQSDASAKPAALEPKLALTKEGKNWKTIVDPKTALSESAIQSGSTLCGRIVRVMRRQLLEALKDRRTRYQDFGRSLPFEQLKKQQSQTGVGETGAPKQ